MNILFVIPYVPSLIYVRPYNLIRHLAQKGHKIHLLTLIASEADRQAAAQLDGVCTINTFPLPRWRSMLNASMALPTRNPIQASYCWQPAAANWLEQRLLQEKDDVIHVEHLRGVRYGLLAQQVMKRMGRQPSVVWDSVDSISLLFHQAATQASRLTSRLITTLEKGRTAYFEGKMVTKFRQVLVTSPVDRHALLDLVKDVDTSNITVLPNGCDLRYFAPDSDTPREPATLVVSGKMSYHANMTMTLYLANQILPLVWEKKPNTKLWIVGKDPGPELVNLQKNPNILVTGQVDDIRPYLRSATLSVSPILYGAGIQNKILEAMACGTPVVTTSHAIQSLAVKKDRDICVADNPGAFAQTILDLFADPEKRVQLGKAGYHYVQRNHNWANISAQLENIYQNLINKT